MLTEWFRKQFNQPCSGGILERRQVLFGTSPSTVGWLAVWH